MRIGAIMVGLLTLSQGFVASPASAELLIKVNKSAQTLTVARDGETLHTWPVSTGRTGYATPSGSFTALRMQARHFSKEWDDAPMPHSVFFTEQGHAIHGSYQTKYLGSPASHGCVRLSPGNAAALFALVKREGLSNTRVTLTGSERVALAHAKAQRATRSTPHSRDDDPSTAMAPPEGEAPTGVRSSFAPYSRPPEYIGASYGYQHSPFVQREDN